MNSNKSLFLFDIDGTLISPGITARGLFIEIAEELTGKKISLEFQHVAGFTDPLILKDMLLRAGIHGIELDAAIEKFFPIYYERLEQRYVAATDKKIFDEVGNLLNDLSEEKNIYLGLVTGNMKRSALIKLSPFDLERFFTMPRGLRSPPGRFPRGRRPGSPRGSRGGVSASHRASDERS